MSDANRKIAMLFFILFNIIAYSTQIMSQEITHYEKYKKALCRGALHTGAALTSGLCLWYNLDTIVHNIREPKAIRRGYGGRNCLNYYDEWRPSYHYHQESYFVGEYTKYGVGALGSAVVLGKSTQQAYRNIKSAQRHYHNAQSNNQIPPSALVNPNVVYITAMSALLISFGLIWAE